MQFQLVVVRRSAKSVCATGGAAVFGWFFKTRKRRLISGYLSKIESTCKDQSVNSKERKARLNQIRNEVLNLVKEGKIEEAQFSILETEVGERIRELT